MEGKQRVYGIFETRKVLRDVWGRRKVLLKLIEMFKCDLQMTESQLCVYLALAGYHERIKRVSLMSIQMAYVPKKLKKMQIFYIAKSIKNDRICSKFVRTRNGLAFTTIRFRESNSCYVRGRFYMTDSLFVLKHEDQPWA